MALYLGTNKIKVIDCNPESYSNGYEAGQKSMYDESKIIEKTASAIHEVDLYDVSEVIHDIPCQIEAVELLDITKYELRQATTDTYTVGFVLPNLVEGQDYIFRSNKPLSRIKISNYSSGNNSVAVSGGNVTEATFTMTRHSAISATATQYLFVQCIGASNWVQDISELEGYELSIQLADTNPESVVITANDREYLSDENGFVTIKSDGPLMNISTASSWKISVDYHRSTGCQSEYDNFWDNFQNNGSLASYQYTFCGSAWNDNTFYPKYDIKLGLGYSGTNAFWSCAVSNLAERFEELGLIFDTTLCGYWSSMFQNIKSVRLPTLNCTHAMDYSSTSSFQNVFLNATSLETIDKMIVPENLLYKNNTFQGCSKLKNIVFEGVIAETINFQWSPLTADSMKSIISCLKDFSGTTSAGTKTITFSEACWAELEASGLSPAGGTWEDYVTSLGWNV